MSFGAGASNEVKTEPTFEDPKSTLLFLNKQQNSDVVRKANYHVEEVKERITEEQKSETSHSRENKYPDFEKVSLNRPDSLATFKPLAEDLLADD